MQNVFWQPTAITPADRIRHKPYLPGVIWFTGLSGSGKSTLASALERELFQRGIGTFLLDGDNVRHGLCRDLGFSDADRNENIRRVAEVARLMVDAGLIVICAFISPFQAEREMAKKLFLHNEFIEVYLKTPIEVCESRDPKGLYKKARSGALPGFTGIDSQYQIPEQPDIALDTSVVDVPAGVAQLLQLLITKQRLNEHAPLLASSNF